MSKDKKKNNKKFTLILSISCVVIAVFIFVFLAITEGWFDKNKIAERNRLNSITYDENGNVKIKNLIMLQNNSFDPQTLDAKIGEMVTFQNNNRGPLKIIGDGWQTPYLDQGAVFTKGDFKEGQNNFYLESNPMNIGIVNMK